MSEVPEGSEVVGRRACPNSSNPPKEKWQRTPTPTRPSTYTSRPFGSSLRRSPAFSRARARGRSDPTCADPSCTSMFVLVFREKEAWDGGGRESTVPVKTRNGRRVDRRTPRRRDVFWRCRRKWEERVPGLRLNTLGDWRRSPWSRRSVSARWGPGSGKGSLPYPRPCRGFPLHPTGSPGRVLEASSPSGRGHRTRGGVRGGAHGEGVTVPLLVPRRSRAYPLQTTGRLVSPNGDSGTHFVGGLRAPRRRWGKGGDRWEGVRTQVTRSDACDWDPLEIAVSLAVRPAGLFVEPLRPGAVPGRPPLPLLPRSRRPRPRSL